MTEDVVAWFNLHTGMNLTPIFDQYLRHAAISRAWSCCSAKRRAW